MRIVVVGTNTEVGGCPAYLLSGRKKDFLSHADKWFSVELRGARNEKKVTNPDTTAPAPTSRLEYYVPPAASYQAPSKGLPHSLSLLTGTQNNLGKERKSGEGKLMVACRSNPQTLLVFP